MKRSRLDAEQAPLARNALERASALVDQRDSRSGNQVGNRARHHYAALASGIEHGNPETIPDGIIQHPHNPLFYGPVLRPLIRAMRSLPAF